MHTHSWMFFLYCSFACSVVLANIEGGDVRVNMPPPAESMGYFTSRHSRRLAKEDFKKTSPNLFDLHPHCEQMGRRYCDYASHAFGSGFEFASWSERTQFLYTNMVRMDYKTFQKPPYAMIKGITGKDKYGCTPKFGLPPYYWSSELTQAARFHCNEMIVHDFVAHSTHKNNADLFDGASDTGGRIMKFVTSDGISWGENVCAGFDSPLDATNAWLSSEGHCKQIFGSRLFLGVGHIDTGYDKNTGHGNSRWVNYWTQNFWGKTDTGPDVPKNQDIIAGSHDFQVGTIQFGTNRFLLQVPVCLATLTQAVSSNSHPDLN